MKKFVMYFLENDCFSAGGTYTGKVTCTVTGVTCQHWTVDTPHVSNYKGFGNNNFCRNSESYAPWCYTLDVTKKWDFCHVPSC